MRSFNIASAFADLWKWNDIFFFSNMRLAPPTVVPWNSLGKHNLIKG